MSASDASITFALTGAASCFVFLRLWYPRRGVVLPILAATMVSELVWVIAPTICDWVYIQNFGRRPPDLRADFDIDVSLDILVLIVFWVGAMSAAAATAVAYAYHLIKK